MSCCGGTSAVRKRAILEANSPLGAYLDDAELDSLADLTLISRFAAGGSLPESPFYVVISGSVEVREDAQVLCTKQAGPGYICRSEIIFTNTF